MGATRADRELRIRQTSGELPRHRGRGCLALLTDKHQNRNINLREISAQVETGQRLPRRAEDCSVGSKECREPLLHQIRMVCLKVR